MNISRKALAIALAIMTVLAMVPSVVFADDTENVAVIGISLDSSSITVEEGSSVSLVANIEPEDATNKNILWSSDDESVATVDEGVVSGVSAGSTEITATTEEGSFSASCTVNVKSVIPESSDGDDSIEGDEDIEDDKGIVGDEGDEKDKGKDAVKGIVDDEENADYEDLEDDYEPVTYIGLPEADEIKDQTYTGKAITPKVVIKSDQGELIEGKDYEAEYYDNINAGTAYIYISGIGKYEGDSVVYFKILPVSLKSATLSSTSYFYDNKVKIPGVSVIGPLSDKKLTKGKDYTIKYSGGRKEVGKYSVTIKGKGNYKGLLTKYFTIKPVSLKSATLSKTSYVYSTKAKIPGVSVIGSVNSKKLTKGKDYTIKYSSGRKAVGKYSVTIKGKGNYKGLLTKYFIVKPSKAVTTSAKVSSNKMTVVAKAKASAYGGSGLQIAYKPSGGSWKYVKTTSKTKTIKVAASKKYSVKTRAYKKVGGTTYYGAWSNAISSSKKVKISFNANKGKVKTKSKLAWTNGKYGKLPVPTRKGYKFRGWYTKKVGGNRITSKTATKYYKNHTLYAHWFGPRGKGEKLSRAEYNRIDYGMSYDDVSFLIGGEGDRVSAYTDSDYVDASHEEWVDDGYWDYYYDDDGNEHQYWVDDGYYETVDDSYWVDHYHETYEFEGQNSGYVEFEFVDGVLDEIYTHQFK